MAWSRQAWAWESETTIWMGIWISSKPILRMTPMVCIETTARATLTTKHAHPGGPCFVVKVALAVVSIQTIGVIRKMGFEEIQMPIQIVVSDSHAHACLLHAIVAQGHAAQDSFLAKRSIVVVHEEQARRGVAGHVDVGPTLFFKIRSNHRHAVRLCRLADSCLL